MSQHNVERCIGRLLTDEAFRHRFARDPLAMLQSVVEQGMILSDCERRAILAIDPGDVERFAQHLDPCIVKADLNLDHS